MRRASSLAFTLLALGCGDPSNDTPLVDAGAVDAGSVVDAFPTLDGSVQDSSVRDSGDAAPADATARTDAETEDSALPDAWVPPPPPDAPSGPFADAAAPCEPESAASLCGRVGAECGEVSTVDSCGTARTVSCGSCAAGSFCGAGAAPNRCEACVGESNVAFCARLGKSCGAVTASDNCGAARTATCGACASNETCTALNVCECVPESNAAFCTRFGAECGTLAATDNCGLSRSVSCGGCASGTTCGGGGVAHVCGAPLVCAPPAATPPFATLTVPGSSAFGQAVCGTAQIDAFFDACLGSSATASACVLWRTANPSCQSCMLTDEASSAYGPLVVRAAAVEPLQNPLGFSDATFSLGSASCLERVAAGCGVAYFRYEACLEAACDGAPACLGAAATTVDGCRSAARSGVCNAAFVAAFGAGSGACSTAIASAGPSLAGDACLPTATERASLTSSGLRGFVTRLALKFCGP